MGTKDGMTHEADLGQITTNFGPKFTNADPVRLSPTDKKSYDTCLKAKAQYAK